MSDMNTEIEIARIRDEYDQSFGSDAFFLLTCLDTATERIASLTRELEAARRVVEVVRRNVAQPIWYFEAQEACARALAAYDEARKP